MIHRIVKRSLFKVQRAPGVLIGSAFYVVWALSSRTLSSYKAGYFYGVNVADYFLDRYPEIQQEFRDFVRSGK